MKTIKIFLFAVFIFCCRFISFSQTAASCPFITPVASPATVCAGQCSNLTATALLTKTTTTYSVQSIPHAPPIPYNQAGGTGVSINTDDVWSGQITIPFNFCFYGVSYNRVLIGSNGNLSFSFANANGFCPWSYTAAVPSTNLVNAGSIFGPYHDIDPSVCGSIKYYTTGTAPCRKFIVSYNTICQFSCTTIKSVHMIVLNELTNYIDVYVQAKPTCTGWNGGRAVIGIQNPAGTAGIAAPGRNTGAWTVTTPEAWRFVPNGANNYTLTWTGPSGTLTTNTLGPVSVCPTTNTTYTASLAITNCDNAVYTFTNTVAVNVSPSATPTFNSVNPICQGASIAALPTTSTNGVSGSWSPAINNSATTTYTFTPSATCTATNTLSIVVTPTVTPLFTQVPAICSGNSVSPLPTTSNNNITGSWSPGINSSATTTYTFTPTAGQQCVNPTQMTISVNNNTLPTFTQAPPACEGSAIIALPSTSNNGIVGVWSPSINNTATTTYTFTPNANQCAIDNQMTVTINPNINPTFNSINPICPGGAINLQSTSNNNFTGTWSPATNNSATTTYTFTPSAGQCATTSTISVVVNQPIVPQVTGTNTVCVGQSTTLTASNANTYTWTPVSGLSASTGNIVIASPTTGTEYTVTSTDQNGCVATTNYSVSVSSIPVLSAITSQTVCAGQNTSAVSFNSNVTGTTVSWTNDQASVGLAASGNGTVSSFSGTNSGSAPVTAIVTATPTANTCVGLPQTFSITVNPIPVLSAISPQTLCSGQSVSPTSFTSSVNNTSISWTNTNSSIGLPFSGTGNLPGFTATNIDPAPIFATITASPSSNGCNGLPVSFTITVNPLPILTAVNSQTLCAGQNTTAVNYTCNVTGADINWTNTENGIGLGSSGIGSIAPFVGTNTGANPITGVITATPSANGCTGTPRTFSITVNPVPELNAINSQTLCAGNTVNGITYATSLTGTTVNWTNTETGIGLIANGTGDISGFTGTNNSASPITGTITATPSLNGCSGTPQTYSITVNPVPVLTAVNSQTLCAGDPVSAINYVSTANGTNIDWVNTESGIGLASSGNGNIGSFTSTNNSGAPLIAVITANPSANVCDGTPITFTITVNNQVLPDFTQVPAVCDGGVLSPLPTLSNNNITGTWSPAINNSTTTTYTFTPTSGQCAVNTNMTIAVGSNILPLFDQVQTICSGDAIANLPTTSNNGLLGTWSPALNNTTTTTYSFTPSPNQCAISTNMTIQVNLPVTPQFTAVNPICAGGSLNSLPTASTNGIVGSWLPPINNLTTTQYTFTPVSGSCANEINLQIEIYPKPSLVDVNSINETCTNSNGSISIGTINGGTPSYQYSLNNAPFISTSSFNNLTAGSYTIIVNDLNSCSDTISTSLTNTPGPIAMQVSTTQSICGTPTGSIAIDGVTGGTAPYTYNINNTGFNSSPTLGNLLTGNYPIVVRDANGCVFSQNSLITGQGPVNANFNLSPESGIAPVLVSFTNTSTTPNAQFIWNLGITSIDTIAFQPNNQLYETQGVFPVTLIATNGNPACNDTITKYVTVEIDPYIWVPNIFSPNGDNTNEDFFVKSRGYIDLKVIIFNRWGNIINSFDGVLGSWDGKDTSGNDVSEGTYYYFISGKRYDSEPFEANGYMMLVR